MFVSMFGAADRPNTRTHSTTTYRFAYRRAYSNELSLNFMFLAVSPPSSKGFVIFTMTFVALNYTHNFPEQKSTWKVGKMQANYHENLAKFQSVSFSFIFSKGKWPQYHSRKIVHTFQQAGGTPIEGLPSDVSEFQATSSVMMCYF